MSGVLLSFIKDLAFSSKLRAVTQELGIEHQNVRALERWETSLAQTPRTIVIDLGLGEEALSALQAARLLAPQVRVLAFFPHVETELGERATALGAEVMPRSRFMRQLAELIAAVCGGQAAKS
ncbi:MAG: hypothetical protein K1X79_13715 [Oligoflexia bacterium]|nr:hypothetical protein [Oligoflexia bacterium]